MPRLPILLVALIGAGCAATERDAGRTEPAGEVRRAGPVVPAWLGNEFADGTVRFRYPNWWKRSTSTRWGALLSDNRSRHPAFVSIQYLDDRLPETIEQFARLAARELRPPAGRGLTLLYTQPARIGEVRGFEAAFAWQARTATPLGPTLRTFGIEPASGRSAFIVFAAERPSFHGGVFGWIRKTMRWTESPRRVHGA
jgi:hypothetical protein